MSKEYYEIHKREAKKLGLTIKEYFAQRKGNKSKAIPIQKSKPVEIDFSKVQTIDKIAIDENMLKIYKSGQVVDDMFSFEGGIPVCTNVMITGDPGAGKTTIMLHTMANLQMKNKHLKCLFISAEMGCKGILSYKKRFPIIGCLQTLFASEFAEHNMKDVIEQLFEKGFDYILVDSIAELLATVREDSGMSQARADKWILDLCVKHNKGENSRKVYSTMLLIQQVTKSGQFIGSNKLKHICDAHMELKKRKRETPDEVQRFYMFFSKNRNGNAFVECEFTINADNVKYGQISQEAPEIVDEEEVFQLSI